MYFYKCEICKKIIISKEPMIVSCCNQEMKELIPNTSEGAGEKHIPVVKMNGTELEVFVGEIMHPMIEDHFIEWILLEEENGYQIEYLKPEQEAKVKFQEVQGKAVYAYCNIHGLWKKEMEK